MGPGPDLRLRGPDDALPSLFGIADAVGIVIEGLAPRP